MKNASSIINNEPRYSDGDIYYYHGDHLGSATWITDATGAPVQYLQYLPTGEIWQNQMTGNYNERFKFTGKEHDEESGYDYFGARYYWSLGGIWTAIDPLADKYPSNSPYIYCSGNPLKYVDPDGRDIWDIDQNGNIRLLGRTEDNFDRLGTLIKGEFDKNNYVKLNDKKIISRFLSSNTSQDGDNFIAGKNGNEIAKLFLFAAKNSEVEWSMSGYIENGYRRYGVSTSHNTERVSSAYSLLGVDERHLLFIIHSHSREDGTRGASTYDPIKQIPNDMSNFYDMYKRFVGYNQKTPAHYVYHTYSGNLYYYNLYNSSIFIRTISSYNNGLNFLFPTR